MSSSGGPADDPACAPRVLVVEDEEQPRDDHIENLQRWGCIPVVAVGQGQELLDDAIRKARAHRCHIAFVDMRLVRPFPPYDTSGLDLVPQLQPTISVVVSGYGDLIAVRQALLEKGAFDFIGKEEGPERLKAALDRAAQLACACRRRLRISWPAGLSSATITERFFPGDDAVPDDEASDLLSRLFPEAHTLKIETIGGASRTPSPAPRSRAVILKVSEPDREPVAVKIAFTSRIREEADRYRYYVHERLVGRFAARLDRHFALWDLGGAVYTFIGASDDVVTFTAYYASKPAENIRTTLERLFGRAWSRLYRDRQRQADSLFVAYSRVWDEKWHERLRTFPDRDPLLAYPDVPMRLPNPITWLIRRVGLDGGAGGDASFFPNADLAVTHGDMQGDNVFVGEFGEPWLIDHERTGFGPILQDFVELEVDILTRLAAFDGREPAEFYRLAAAVVGPRTIGLPLPASTTQAETAKTFEVISCLRRLAAEQTGIQDARQYLWGLLLNAVFRATLLLKHDEAGPSDQRHEHERLRALLLGSLICHRLDYWDTAWPPPDWPPIADVGVRMQTSQSPAEGGIVPVDRAAFPHGYALLIGVGETAHERRWSLPATVRDAQAIEQALVDPQRCGYLPEHVHLLYNRAASAEGIRAGLRWLAERASTAPDATVVIYFSGHGWRGQDGRYALVPADVHPDQMADSILWGHEITTAIHAIPARRVLVLIDACHAGGITSAKGDPAVAAGFSKAPPSADLLRALHQGEGRAVISSSRNQQFSYLRPDGDLSIFTYHVIEALHGAASLPGDSTVRVSNLINYLGKTVPASARSAWGVEQTPWTDQASEDFAVALVPAPATEGATKGARDA
jgi:CheY-like chemotaxis protein